MQAKLTTRKMGVFFKSVLIYFAIALPVRAQTAADLAAKYPPVSAYEIRPGILMTAKYAADGQVCEMVLEVRHYHSPKEIDLDKVIPGKLETSLIDELVPKSERGEPNNRWSKREPKDAWVDPDSYIAGGVSYIKRSYENVTIEQHGYYRCHSGPISKEKDKADCGEGGDEVIVIRWTKRACAAGKSSELEKAKPENKNPTPEKKKDSSS